MNPLRLQRVHTSMINGFGKIIIRTADIEASALEYGALLGGFEPRNGEALLPLSNVAISLVSGAEGADARIDGLELLDESGESGLPADCRGLPLKLVTARDVSPVVTSTGISGVDHIVLRSCDADDCIRLFGQEFGMRLALDQQVPEWGGRMLFFRCGKLTLEVIQHLDNPVERDHFWGITYLCPDLEFTLGCLDAAGVAHSGARDGRKPGTVVATVKSHTLGIPTLLIQPA